MTHITLSPEGLEKLFLCVYIQEKKNLLLAVAYLVERRKFCVILDHKSQARRIQVGGVKMQGGGS